MKKRKKFGIVCKTKEDFEKIKNKYWREELGELGFQYEFVPMIFDELHVSLDWLGENKK